MSNPSKKDAGCLHPEMCSGQEIRLRKSSLIFEEGEKLTSFYVVKEGACLLVSQSENKEQRIHRILGPGDIMGKRSFFTGEGAICSAHTLNEVTLSVYSADEMLGFLKSRPGICQEVMAELIQDGYRSEEEEPVYNVHKDITQRLAALLHYLATKFGTNSSNELRVQLKRIEMAAVLGTSPEYITNLLKRFESWGVIKGYKNKIQLNGLKQLESMFSP